MFCVLQPDEGAKATKDPKDNNMIVVNILLTFSITLALFLKINIDMPRENEITDRVDRFPKLEGKASKVPILLTCATIVEFRRIKNRNETITPILSPK